MGTPARVVIGIVLAVGIFFAGYMANRPSGPSVSAGSAKQAMTTSFTMHPQYTSDHPGDCPICCMRLEPTKGDGCRGTTDFSQASVRTAGSANRQFPIDALRGLGMSDLQVEEIHRTRTAAPRVNIYSPVSGFVLERNVSPGQRFDKWTELYRIPDLSRVWVSRRPTSCWTPRAA